MPRAQHVMEYGLMGCFDDPSSLFCSILMPPCMFGVTMSHIRNFPCGTEDFESLETPIEIAALRDEGDKKRCITGCLLYTVGCCFAQAWARKKIEEDLAVRFDGVKPERIAEHVKEMGDAEDESKLSTFRDLAKHFLTALCCLPCALSQEARAVTLAHAAREVEDAGAEKSS